VYCTHSHKMKVLAFDTETTGLPENYNAPVTESSKWPHIIQLSFIVFDTEQKEVTDYSDRIIKLAGSIPISAKSIEIHKITRERSEHEGITISCALAEFAEAIKDVDTIIAHNLAFDKNMIMAELHRHQLPNCFEQATLKEYCTMMETTDLCKLSNSFKATQYKWPRLGELHKHLFGTEPRGTHNAIADVMICLRCYVYLICHYDIATDPNVKMIFRTLYQNYCGA